MTAVEEQVKQLGKPSGNREKTVMTTDPEGNHIAFTEGTDDVVLLIEAVEGKVLPASQLHAAIFCATFFRFIRRNRRVNARAEGIQTIHGNSLGR